MVSALATICVRNESLNIQRCIDDLLQDNIEVILIDNESTDDTVPIAQKFLGHGLLRIETLPWKGFFSLLDALDIERSFALNEKHDWIIHIDADEWLCSPIEGESLLEGIRKADESGANCINFNEFVFIPEVDKDYSNTDYTKFMLNYYFFQPCYPRLMRAWKKVASLDNRSGGGHLLAGKNCKIYKNDFILRHYIALSALHARSKYLTRRFSDEELSRGWHNNRITINENNIAFPPINKLHTLNYWNSKSFITTCPQKKHYWEWQDSIEPSC